MLPGDLFFFNDTATTEIYTLSLHDALPICNCWPTIRRGYADSIRIAPRDCGRRSEEHTSELQSRSDVVCRLLLEKENDTYILLGTVNEISFSSVALTPIEVTTIPRHSISPA